MRKQICLHEIVSSIFASAAFNLTTILMHMPVVVHPTVCLQQLNPLFFFAWPGQLAELSIPERDSEATPVRFASL